MILAQRVTQETNDNEAALLPMVDLVEQQCGDLPQRVSADSGFFSITTCKRWKSEVWMRMCQTTIWRGY